VGAGPAREWIPLASLAPQQAPASFLLFSGIRDPHRVSRETVAPGEARASGTDAGQPKNRRTEAGAGTSLWDVRGQGPLPQG
jgi:hypothetical protein